VIACSACHSAVAQITRRVSQRFSRNPTPTLAMMRRLLTSLFVLSFALALGACGDTWSGAKKDTGENLEKTGSAIERAGEKVKN
jgi:predicted small secreted protein